MDGINLELQAKILFSHYLFIELLSHGLNAEILRVKFVPNEHAPNF